MPIIDSKRGVLVVRVVYDGPPLSGKTTSLHALARGLGATVTTPEERDGRTMYFDWVDYVGGLFEGRQIRCQIVSVPGQRALAGRRRELLASADAVVLVADTREHYLSEALEALRDLLPYCRAQQPPVGVVVQANKRDAPDSVHRDRLYARFGEIAPLALVETVATSGDGIREAFVFGVRLALDRVRACADADELHHGEPACDNPEALLQSMQDIPMQDIPMRAAEGVRSSLAVPIGEGPSPCEYGTSEPVVCDEPYEEEPFVPDPMMPGGFIWPPVDGRVLLHEVAQLELVPARNTSGDWAASGRGCQFHSAGPAIFDDADSGRRALIEWARLHAVNGRKLSSGRTVILAGAGNGRFRLWQLVRTEESLRERLAETTGQGSARETAGELIDAAAHLLRARAELHSTELPVPCTLWTISGDPRSQPRFVGLLPYGDPAAAQELAGLELLEREFGPVLRALALQREDYQQVVGELTALAGSGGGDVAGRLLWVASGQGLSEARSA